MVRSLTLVVAALALALWLAACERGDGDSPGPTGGATEATSPSPAPDPSRTLATEASPSPTATSPEPAEAASPPEPVTADLGEPGPYAVERTAVTVTRESSTDGEVRELETVVWYPASLQEDAIAGTDGAGAPFPLILFSHGSGGNPEQSRFYTEHLASHGFVVAAMPHPGNTSSDCFPCSNVAALLDSAANRPDDVIAVYEALIGAAVADSPLHGLIDARRVGVTGHSFGGWTMLAVLAEDERFLAGLPMAPPPANGIALRSIEVPIMLMSGEIDDVTPSSDQRAVFSRLLGAPAVWLLTFERAGHFAFSDACPAVFRGCRRGDLPQSEAHRIVNRYATAFFTAYVAGEPAYASVLEPAEALEGGVLTIEATR